MFANLAAPYSATAASAVSSHITTVQSPITALVGFAPRCAFNALIRLIPVLLEQQFFDPVGMQHLVIEHMPEHDKHGIMIERLVHGGFLPLVW